MPPNHYNTAFAPGDRRENPERWAFIPVLSLLIVLCSEIRPNAGIKGKTTRRVWFANRNHN
jgi:hypothetical protein